MGTRGKDAFGCRLCQIGGVARLHSRDEIVHVFLREDGGLAGALAPVLRTIVLIPCRRYGDERTAESALNQVVEDVYQPRAAITAAPQEILLRNACPPVQQVNNVVFL